ncbi:MAG: hypothetical protein LUH14_03275 [Clostridiaceae bacterium]|nr:hypothetical protein [Clostridiaceae bacterium]
MNCSFKILWFEDERSWYSMEKYKVETMLNEFNLLCEVTRRRGDDFDEKDFDTNYYDLIIMDYKLASGDTGDKVIRKIRNTDVLTDVLFYSSQYSEMVNSIKNTDDPLDGIYYANRKMELFEEKVYSLIRKIVHRSEDIVNLRGFVLDNACDFEVRIKEIINILLNKMDSKEKQIINIELKNVFEGKKSRLEKNKAKIYREEDPFIEANNAKFILYNSDRLSLIESMTSVIDEARQKDIFSEYQHFRREYEDNISCYRNALGHLKSGDKTICIKGIPTEINEDLHKQLRKNIHEFNGVISKLEELITNKI